MENDDGRLICLMSTSLESDCKWKSPNMDGTPDCVLLSRLPCRQTRSSMSSFVVNLVLSVVPCKRNSTQSKCRYTS